MSKIVLRVFTDRQVLQIQWDLVIGYKVDKGAPPTFSDH